MVALANHPALIEEHFEAVAGLELSHAELRRLHAGTARRAGTRQARMIGAGLPLALGEAGLGRGLCARGFAGQKRAGSGRRSERPPSSDARDAFVQALHLQLSARLAT